MKKFFVLLFALMLLASSALAADTTVDQQANVGTPATAVANVVPGIEVTAPGTIKLAIAWTNPTLNFTTRQEESSQYELSAPVNVAFTLTNTSVAGQGTASVFNGTLNVGAAAVFAGGTAKTYKNIEIDMLPTSAVDISNATGSNANTSDFKLTYQNYAGATEYITDSPSVANVQGNLTANVTFTITPKTN